MNKKKKICFLSDGHQLFDDRMYWKQALSLKKNGYDVCMVVADKIDESGTTEHGIDYVKVKRIQFFQNRILNALVKFFYYPTHQKMAKMAIQTKADLYHVPDSEPNKFIHKIKKATHKPKLVYDAREPIDNNLKLFSKATGLKKKVLFLYADCLQKREYKKAEIYDFVMMVDHGLKNRFLKNSKVKNPEVVYNYTNLLSKRTNVPLPEREFDAIYCGVISEERGFYTILKSCKLVVAKKKDYKLLLLGNIFDQNLRDYLHDFISQNQLEKNIIWKDHVRFDKVSDFYNQSKIGLNILHPADAFQDIIQIKLFEYMNFGLPIITSNFGEMQHYVLENKVGITVDPFDENALSDAQIFLFSNPDKMEEFGRNGIMAVDERFNWDLMEEKMLGIYENLLRNESIG